MSNIVIPTLKFHLNSGDRVALKADNGLYWTRDAAHENWITASAATVGETSQFVVHTSENSQLSLEADTGRFAALLTVDDFQVIAAVERSVDQYSRFTITVFDDATVALRADNGLYLSRYSYKGVETIAAVKKPIDQYCHFRIIEIE
jgi:hypothetical protein